MTPRILTAGPHDSPTFGLQEPVGVWTVREEGHPQVLGDVEGCVGLVLLRGGDGVNSTHNLEAAWGVGASNVRSNVLSVKYYHICTVNTHE